LLRAPASVKSHARAPEFAADGPNRRRVGDTTGFVIGEWQAEERRAELTGRARSCRLLRRTLAHDRIPFADVSEWTAGVD
jgi:hypothetical protein